MKKLLTLVFAVMVGLSFISTASFADANKGQKIFVKKMKKSCGFSGGVMAKKHTQDEWKSIYDSGKFNNEMVKFCPKAKPLKKKYVSHVYDFMYNYASDSGNVPS